MGEQRNKLKVIYQDVKRILLDFYVLITIIVFVIILLAAMSFGR